MIVITSQQLAEGHTISLPKPNGGTFPLVYRERVYLMSSSEARDQFAKNPYRYLHLPANPIPVSIRLAIVGPPKSGKSTGKHYCYTMCTDYLCLSGKKICRVIWLFEIVGGRSSEKVAGPVSLFRISDAN